MRTEKQWGAKEFYMMLIGLIIFGFIGAIFLGDFITWVVLTFFSVDISFISYSFSAFYVIIMVMVYFGIGQLIFGRKGTDENSESETNQIIGASEGEDTTSKGLD